MLALTLVALVSVNALAQKRHAPAKKSASADTQSTPYQDGQIVQTTICKGLPIPAGYVTAGDTTDGGCPKGAWILKRKGTALVSPYGPDQSTAGVSSSYDRFRDVTTLRINEVRIFRENGTGNFEPTEMFLSAACAYRGTVKSTPQSVTVFFRMRGMFADAVIGSASSAIFLADGERFQSAELSHDFRSDSKEDENGFIVSYDISYVGVTLPFDEFSQIANSSNVEVRLGGKEFSLGAGLNELRSFARQLKAE
jgi:hypothetical protein